VANSVQEDSRFDESMALVSGLVRFVSDANEKLPPYSADTRKRDEKLLELTRSESLLSSTLAYTVARQKAAPWLLTGAARQVAIYSRNLYHAHKKGWRTWLSMQATAYYSTNLGFVSEIVRNDYGVGSDIYAIDSTRCRLTNDLDKPVIYYPRNGNKVDLLHEEILHANSMPSIEEKMAYAGFCATERALSWVRMAMAIQANHLEKMGINPPKGILFGKGIKGKEWKDATEKYNEDKANAAGSNYDGVMGLFSSNSDANLELIALSELPDQFDIVKYAEVLVNGICAAYGVPPFNVWAMSTGSFGRGLEAQVSNQEASRSGAMEFTGSMQGELSNKYLPSTVSFTFDLSGSAIQKLIAENQGEKIKNIIELYVAKNEIAYKNTPQALENAKAALESKQKAIEEVGSNPEDEEGKEVIEQALRIITRAMEEENREGEGIITRDEARQLLAADNFIPHSWTESLEDVTVTDIQVARQIAKENPRIREAANYYYDEPVVQFIGNINDIQLRSVPGKPADYKFIYPTEGKVVTLWERGEDMNRKEIY
jgi:hypothetical protein